MADRATLTAGESATVDYTLYTTELDQEARDMAAANAALTSRLFRNYAAICYRAGRAERIDPEPALVRSCGTCGGVRTCDFAAHRSRSA